MKKNVSQDDDESLNSFSSAKAQKEEKLRAIQEQKNAKKSHKMRNRSKRKSSRRFFRLMWFVMILFISAVSIKLLLSGMNDVLAINRQDSEITVEIPESLTSQQSQINSESIKSMSSEQINDAKKKNQEITAQIAELLENKGMIKEPMFFSLYSKLRKADGDYQPGTYKLSQKMDYEGLINKIQASDDNEKTIKLMVPEGINAIELADMLEEKQICKKDDFLNALNSDEFDSKYEIIKDLNGGNGRYYKLEGYLFPDTYDFYVNESVEDVVQKFLQNSNQHYTQDLQKQAEDKGYTFDQILTIASIIEAEAANEKDMYNISSVIHNRLAFGYQYGIDSLDCDSTIYYPYRSKETVPDNEKSTFKSKYNTYKIKTLPAGPICNPGIRAIKAALDPNSTRYLYFCHDQRNQTPYYAYSIEQHKENLELAGLSDDE